MPELDKPIGPKSIHQETLATKLKEGTLEIIFQVELDTAGNTVITFFKDQQKLSVEKPKSTTE